MMLECSRWPLIWEMKRRMVSGSSMVALDLKLKLELEFVMMDCDIIRLVMLDLELSAELFSLFKIANLQYSS